ncbi:hypothetical protein ABPG75_008405 [Micractinium tetrahymenae]
MARTAAFAFIALLLVGSALAGAPAYDAPPPSTNCNRSCWKAPNLFGLKNTLFRLCKAQVSIIDTNETKRGSGKSGAPKYGVCGTFIYYKFANNDQLKAFQQCQSKQSLYINQVVNKGYKQILTSPPKYSRC